MIESPSQIERLTPTRGTLPVCRSDLIVRPHSNDGEYVIKDPVSGAYYHLGPQESLLLLKLDGQHSVEQIRLAYERRFEQPLSAEDLDDFVGLAGSMHLLADESLTRSASDAPMPPRSDADAQSILYWRKSLFDPNRLFNWLEPKIRFIWTPAFLVLSALAMLAALAVVWVNRFELVSRFGDVLSWKTFLLPGWRWLSRPRCTNSHTG